ncbi:MAG: hypothetical protein A2Z38_11235 [Planctomycetes bacterium RBG_19FT_COMBO_48_8]|nr:MAG: hypothetical protein A2Z38_11235 [Planctomycetes bacterium RBG_19FT_COMBO_48_8]
MRKKYRTILALGFCLCPLLITIGCDIQIGDWGQAKHEITVQRQAPITVDSKLYVETSSGSITITGGDVTECSVIASICGRAPTEEEAQQLAEQVKIELETAGSTMTVKAYKPPKKNRCSISISYDITIPKQTNIESASSYGAIELANIKGQTCGKTSSGSIEAKNIEGSVNLDTSYGSVNCRNITGDNIAVKSSSGSITAEIIKGTAQLTTSYGSITCTDMSDGDIKLKTSSGKIKLSNASFGDCDAHTSYGSIVSDELKGKSIKLHSGSGNINVTESSADTTNLSTSYGRITCRQITTNDITARSGSGSLDIACSDSTPAQIVADLVTSYGSIDFAAPQNYAGQVDLSTSYGSVRTGRPITISGEISKKNLKGTIGEGNGKLHMQTSSGSINLQ